MKRLKYERKKKGMLFLRVSKIDVFGNISLVISDIKGENLSKWSFRSGLEGEM